MAEGNAFVAALLKVAAEHRLKAESARNLMDPYPERSPGMLGDTWRSWLREMNSQLEKEASEHEGLAEVYQRFADRIIGEVAGQLILDRIGELFGEAELELTDRPYDLPYNFAFPHTENYALTWMRYYRGMDLPGNGFMITGI